MEIIRIAGYTELEKLNIAKTLPGAEAARGERPAASRIIEFIRQSSLLGIIRHYTKEAGVRNLEREIAAVCRKVAVEVVKRDRKAHVQRDGEEPCRRTSGRARFRYGKAEDEQRSRRGDGARVDGSRRRAARRPRCTVMPGKGKLIITGRLGDVMQESAQAAMSYVRSRADELGLDARLLPARSTSTFTFPEGAIPKDGPSAGITMATALVVRR